ncbi:MAG: hypothetical protein M1812_004811 [Candelaria pacifica]|nr:MAG: hypothetical protein M1812_004811 [Candelaria pacifica]
MLYLGRIALSLCLGAQLITVAAVIGDNAVALNPRRQLTCTRQAGKPKAGDCWLAFDSLPKNDPIKYVFGPGDKQVDYKTPLFFAAGSCAIGIYNAPVKYQRDVSDWFPLRLGLAELVDKCADGLFSGGYYEGWGYNKNLMIAMFAWDPALDLDKLPSMIEVKNRIQPSCEAAVAATPPDKGNTASVSDCSGSSGKQQCLKGASSSRSIGYCAAGSNVDCCKDYTCVPTISSNSEILFGYLSATVSLVGQCLTSQSSSMVTVKRADDVPPAAFRNKQDPVAGTLAMGARADGPHCMQDIYGLVPPEDCLQAWSQMSGVLDGNSELDLLQFGPRGAPRNNFDTLLPFEHGDCMIIISNFPDPGEYDLATSQEMKWAASRVLSSCVNMQGLGGMYFGFGALRGNIAVSIGSKSAAVRRSGSKTQVDNSYVPEPASFDGDSHAARLASTEPCMPWQKASRKSTGSSSQRYVAYCTSQSDCCNGYKCAWQKFTQWFIFLGKTQPFFDGGIGTCVSAIATELSTVQGRKDEVALTEVGPHGQLDERQDRALRIADVPALGLPPLGQAPQTRRTTRRERFHHRELQHNKRSSRKRSDDPFCNAEYGRPNPDDCEKAWHQVPSSYIQRWFFNGNYDALPGRESAKPLEELPQTWQNGDCVVQVKFTLDEELASDPGGDPNAGNVDMMNVDMRPRSPFAYRPFDETSWDEIDNVALDIWTYCVAYPLSGYGGTDLAVSQYKKIEINMYSLDSNYKKAEDEAAAAANPQNQAGANEDTGTEAEPETPPKPRTSLTGGSPHASPYWFMQHCPSGTIYCTSDSDCGAACGPSQSCKLLSIVNQAIMTGLQAAKTSIPGLGTCHPS